MIRHSLVRYLLISITLCTLASACSNQVQLPSATSLNSPIGQGTAASQQDGQPPRNTPKILATAEIGRSPTVNASTEITGYSGGQGKLAFSYDVTGIYQVGLMDMATGKITALTSSPPSGSSEPYWTADGQSIFFSSGPGNKFGIYKMSADGSNQKTLVDSSKGSSFSPAVNPAGDKVIFHSNRDQRMQIYVANADGSNQKNLSSNGFNDAAADWSPDGSKIIFASDRSGEYQLYAMNADGSDQKLVFDHKGHYDFRPRYSPDGKLILFGTQPSLGGDYHLATINVDGTGYQELSRGSGQYTQGAWIGNDTIVYSARHDDLSKFQLYMQRINSQAIIRLTFSNANFRNPIWFP